MIMQRMNNVNNAMPRTNQTLRGVRCPRPLRTASRAEAELKRSTSASHSRTSAVRTEGTMTVRATPMLKSSAGRGSGERCFFDENSRKAELDRGRVGGAIRSSSRSQARNCSGSNTAGTGVCSLPLERGRSGSARRWLESRPPEAVCGRLPDLLCRGTGTVRLLGLGGGEGRWGAGRLDSWWFSIDEGDVAGRFMLYFECTRSRSASSTGITVTSSSYDSTSSVPPDNM